MRHLLFVPLLIAASLAAQIGHSETAVPQSQPQIALSFAPVVKQTAPTVVNIFTTKMGERRSNPFADDPFFGQFFQDMPGTGTPEAQSALGSGVIVSPDGIVLSNYHVIEGATEIRVVLNDRREYPATVMLADADSDLVVLRLEGASDLPALAFDDSEALQVGDLVLAIGNPFGVGQTVSSGIVSGLARSALQVGNGRGYYVQTDAPINPGNSGGALVDMAGHLVGINTAILTQDGGSNGIGFAIPANLAAAVVAQAKAGADHFTRPWAGVLAQPVDAATANALGLAMPQGVLLSDLHPQSPFGLAGLGSGDVVLTVGGQEVNTPQEMNYRLAILGVGASAPVTYHHDGEADSTTLTLITAPDDPPREAVTIRDDVVLRGLSVSRINPAVISELGLPLSANGVVVTDATDYAARAGLAAGDIITAINGTDITSPADVTTAAQDQTRRWEVDILRQGQPMRLRFRI